MAETQGWQELIARLEKATGPDRELDGLIYGQLNGLRRNGSTFILDIDGERFQFEHPTERHPSGPAALYVHGYKVLEFTASLDAALTLVPVGLWWEVRQLHAPTSPMRVFAGGNGMFHARCGISYGEAGHLGQHDCPAIALDIAALKARGI